MSQRTKPQPLSPSSPGGHRDETPQQLSALVALVLLSATGACSDDGNRPQPVILIEPSVGGSTSVDSATGTGGSVAEGGGTLAAGAGGSEATGGSAPFAYFFRQAHGTITASLIEDNLAVEAALSSSGNGFQYVAHNYISHVHVWRGRSNGPAGKWRGEGRRVDVLKLGGPMNRSAKKSFRLSRHHAETTASRSASRAEPNLLSAACLAGFGE